MRREGVGWWRRWREGSEEEEQIELEAGLIPYCHYPHFLATDCELPHNEGHFQGFAPGTDVSSAVITDTEKFLLPLAFTVGYK